MKVAEFKEFVSIMSLSILDLGTPRLGFAFGPLRTWYYATHCGAVSLAGPAVQVNGASGVFSIVSERLAHTLSLLDDEDDLVVTYQPPNLVFQAGAARLSLRTVQEEEAPRIGSSRGATIVVPDQALLRRALKFLRHVTGKKILKPILSGTQANVEGGILTLEATDSMRGAIITLPVEGPDVSLGVVPVVDWAVAVSALPDGPVTLRASASTGAAGSIDVQSGQTKVRIALLQGAFPDLSVLPRDPPPRFKISTKAVVTAVRAASILDQSRVLKVSARGGHVMLTVFSAEVGSFQAIGGEEQDLDFDVLFDADYFSMLDKLGSEVTVHLRDAVSPAMIRGEHGWCYWLSPLVE
jgi:DNA polymerase III sliding clamp (beta) subunit (PCNA family)